jgi:hypothetical protein
MLTAERDPGLAGEILPPRLRGPAPFRLIDWLIFGTAAKARQLQFRRGL